MILTDGLKAIAKKIILIILVSVVITAVASINLLSDENKIHNCKSVMRLEGTYIEEEGKEPFKVRTDYIVSKLPNIVFECTTASFYELVVSQLMEIRPDKYANLTIYDVAGSFKVNSQKGTTFLLIESYSSNKAFSHDLCQSVNKALLAMNGTENEEGEKVNAYDDGLMEFQSVDEAYYVGYSIGTAIIKLAIIFAIALLLGIIIELIYSFAIPFANNRLVVESVVKTNQITVVNKQNWVDDIKELLGYSNKDRGVK